jgi:hypothetical protein
MTAPLSVSITGPNAAEYSITNTSPGGVAPYCAGQTLYPGDACEVGITFIPASVATGKDAVLTVTDGDATQEATIDLTGDGLSP